MAKEPIPFHVPDGHKPDEREIHYDLLLQSDRGRAFLFSRYHRGKIHYLPKSGNWLVWDDNWSRWLEDGPRVEGPGSGAVMRLAKEFLDNCAGLYNVRFAADLARVMGSKRTVYDMLTLAKTEELVGVPRSYFDSDPYVLGVNNGVVDLKTGALRETTPGDRITRHTDSDYVLGHTDERWDRFLHDCTGGDERLCRFLQVYFGYCLTGSNFKEKFLMIRGKAGAGKGTLTQAIVRAMGPYAMTTNYDSLLHQKPGTVREDIASWEGKRLVLTTELPESSSLDANIIKSLTGGDDFRARHLYRGGSELRQTWSCVATCNRFPRLDTTPDSGWWRRIVAVPMPYVPKKQDDTLKEHLLDPRRGGRAVLSWLIEGSKLFYDTGRRLNPPRSVELETLRYRAHADHAGFWLAEKLEEDPDGWLSNADLYDSYEETCRELTVEPMTHRVFGRWLTREGYPGTRKGTSKSRGHYGLRWKPRRVSHVRFVGEEMRSTDD